jgi:hypothetical protein
MNVIIKVLRETTGNFILGGMSKILSEQECYIFSLKTLRGVET